MPCRIPISSSGKSRSGAEAQIAGQTYINFTSYDYLGLNQHPDVGAAAVAATNSLGTSVSASRLVAGERPLHRELEAALARHYATDDALVFVSGHATNVSTIATIVGPKDIIFYDELVHNSASTGPNFQAPSSSASGTATGPIWNKNWQNTGTIIRLRSS
ncbi:MAG: aminotransferase class I/II-fold pyridoxal phosphate-dependent enzyme [Hyphomicrobiaceae bacterium]